MRKSDNSSHNFPSPPRFLLVGFPLLSALCFLGGYALNHRTSHPPHATNLHAPAVQSGSRGANHKAFHVFSTGQEGSRAPQAEVQHKSNQAAIRKTQIQTKTGAGFIVAQDLDPSAAKPVADTLSQVYGLQIATSTISKDRVRVQVGPIYKTKADADKMNLRLKHLGFEWKVIPVGEEQQ